MRARATAPAPPPPRALLSSSSPSSSSSPPRQNLGASPGTWALSKTGKKSAGDTSGFTGYCERLLSGDVVGCEADLSEGTIRFWKNGVHLGVAFTGLENRGLTLVPAICIGSNSGGKQAEVTFVEFFEAQAAPVESPAV